MSASEVQGIVRLFNEGSWGHHVTCAHYTGLRQVACSGTSCLESSDAKRTHSKESFYVIPTDSIILDPEEKRWGLNQLNATWNGWKQSFLRGRVIDQYKQAPSSVQGQAEGAWKQKRRSTSRSPQSLPIV